MFYYITKVLISAGIIVAVSEISKRSSMAGGILASLPLVSFLAMIWLYIDTKSTEKVAELSGSIFWMVLPSLSLFLLLPFFLKNKFNFYLALFISTVIMIFLYFLMVFTLKKMGIKI